jgi:hypothetical protein
MQPFMHTTRTHTYTHRHSRSSVQAIHLVCGEHVSLLCLGDQSKFHRHELLLELLQRSLDLILATMCVCVRNREMQECVYVCSCLSVSHTCILPAHVLCHWNMYVYVYTYIHTYMYIDIHIRMNTYMQAGMAPTVTYMCAC